MSDVELSIALTPNTVTRPILQNRTRIEGVRYVAVGLHPSEMFWRQLRFAHFDVSELSIASLLIAIARGDTTWTALPIFTTRRFFHNGILVRTGSGISTPADLVGKRVGVPEYQQTAAVWVRGALQHEFGVSPGELRWFMERPPDRSHGGATGFAPPPGIELNYIDVETNMGEMLRRGELDASVLYLRDQNLVDRSRIDLATEPAIRPLFEDSVAEGFRYYTKTGLLPINHCVVVRRSLLQRHPWLAMNIYNGFLDAKRAAREDLATLLQPYGTLPHTANYVAASTLDPLPYGISAQRKEAETLCRYLAEQGLTSRTLGIEEIFAPDTLEL